jgi:hypothetical protein
MTSKLQEYESTVSDPGYEQERNLGTSYLQLMVKVKLSRNRP